MSIITDVKEYLLDKLASPSQMVVDMSDYKSPYWDKSQEAPYNPDDLVQRKGIKIYEQMLQDDQVGAVSQMRKDAIISTGYDIEPGDNDNTEATKQSEFMQYCLGDGLDCSFETALEGMLSAHDYGFSVTEKNLKYIDEGDWKGKIGYLNFKDRAPHTFEFRIDSKGNLETLIQYGQSGYEIRLEMDKLIVYTHKKKFGNWYGESDLRRAYRAWFSKAMIIKFWNIYLERYGVPPVIAKYLPGTGKNTRDKIMTMLKNLQAKSVCVIPKNVELEIMNIASKGTSEFERAIDKYNTMISRAFLLPDLLGYSTTSGGTYNLGEKQIDIFKLNLKKYRNNIEDIVNKQIIKPLVQMNFTNVTKYPKFKLRALTEDNQMEILQKWIDSVREKTVKPTEEDEARIREILNFPKRNEDSILLRPGDQMQEDGAFDNDGENPFLPKGKNEGNDKEEKNDREATKEEKKKAHAKLVAYEKRVDFKEVRKVLDNTEFTTSNNIVRAITLMKDELLGGIRKKKIIEENKFKEIENISLHHLPEIKSIFKTALYDVYLNGQKHAKAEVNKKVYAAIAVGNLPPKEAVKYLASKAFELTGAEKAKILTSVQKLLYSGLRAGKSTEDVIFELEEYFANNYNVMQKLPTGELKPIEAIPGRLETVVRTNLTDAYAMGRLNEFRQHDFVVAYQYSAILDGRTTEICNKYNGKIFKANDPLINKLNPPNHYNCRSLLIPILSDEEYNVSNKPALTPATQESWTKFGG